MATPGEWDSILAAIHRLDISPLQVQIEAKILEVTLSGDLSFGVQWWLAGLINTNTANNSSATGYQYNYSQTPTATNPNFQGNAADRHRVALGGTGVCPTAVQGLFYSFLNKNFQVALNTLQTSGQTKIFSAPSLVVMNNQQAQITVGTQVPILSTSIVGIGGHHGYFRPRYKYRHRPGVLYQHGRHAFDHASRKSGRSCLHGCESRRQRPGAPAANNPESADQPAQSANRSCCAKRSRPCCSVALFRTDHRFEVWRAVAEQYPFRREPVRQYVKNSQSDRTDRAHHATCYRQSGRRPRNDRRVRKEIRVAHADQDGHTAASNGGATDRCAHASSYDAANAAARTSIAE